MHAHMHYPAVYSRSILQGVAHMKISPSKMDIPCCGVRVFIDHEKCDLDLDQDHFWKCDLDLDQIMNSAQNVI